MAKDLAPVQKAVIVARGRGRLSLSGTSEPSSVVATRLPVSQHDQLIRMAGQKRMDVSEYLREIIILTLR